MVSRKPERWRVLGAVHGPRSATVLTLLVVAGTAWLGWPVWDSLSSPGHPVAVQMGPWLGAALVCGLGALGVAMWLDSGRRVEALNPVVALVVLNTLVRAVLNPSANGIEFAHALPLLAGIVAGAPAGFMVGASSALLSTITVGEPAAYLPAQAFVWGVSGMLGGLLSGARPAVAWILSWPLALLAGLLSGILLNLIGWGQEPGTTLTSFHPGLPPSEVLARLWAYTAETSLVYDLTRGATTALVLALAGLPLIKALRRHLGWAPPVSSDEPPPPPTGPPRPRGALDELWNESQGAQR